MSSKISDLARELLDDYPAVEVTTVVFGHEFAGKAYCVIPQDRVLAVARALEQRDALVKALQGTEQHLAFQHKWLSDQFDAMGRIRDEGTVSKDTWDQIEATYELWKQVKFALSQALAREALAQVQS